jgi:hypothetical protein
MSATLDPRTARVPRRNEIKPAAEISHVRGEGPAVSVAPVQGSWCLVGECFSFVRRGGARGRAAVLCTAACVFGSAHGGPRDRTSTSLVRTSRLVVDRGRLRHREPLAAL